MVELRQEYDDAVDQKRHIREDGDTDMRYVSGNPWEDKDRKAREDAGRPCLSLDELGQYVNQLINDVRQNKRGIKAAPEGAKATKETADFRQSLIRQIEYRSNAAIDAYPIMFENAAQRSYGYLRIKPDYADHQSFDQELRILPIPNPNMCVEDPYALRPDGADWKLFYFSESWSKGDFKVRWKDAKFQSFDADAARLAPSWVKGGRILVAERWRVVTKKRTLLLIQPPAAGVDPRTGQPAPASRPITAFKDDKDILQKMPPGATVLKDREVDYPTVKQQITNGLEILEENDFPGTNIPFVACYGKILYLDDDGGTRKHILSLIRLARDPAMLYNFYRTCEAEVVGRVPKVTPVGYAGQFAGFEDEWADSSHTPKAYLEVNAKIEGSGSEPLPLPQMQTWEPPIQALEMGAEAARRAIQSAIGASPLPTSAQRRNEKSGIALQQIEDSAQKGSFHFVDHFDGALVRTGQILEELIPHYYDAARDVTVRDKKDQPNVIRINDPEHAKSVDATEGKHDITISVGPRQISERQAASDFADSILQSTILQLLPPEKSVQIAAMAVRLKDVGPIGDEIADILSPPQQEGQMTPQQAQQLQAQVKQLQEQLQQAQQELQGDKAKVEAQTQATLGKAQIETASREKIAGAQLAQKDAESRADNETKLAVAELTARIAHMELFLEERARLGVQQENEQGRQHEAAMAAMSQGGAAQSQAAHQQHAAEQAEAQRAADAERAQQEQAAQAAQAAQQGGA